MNINEVYKTIMYDLILVAAWFKTMDPQWLQLRYSADWRRAFHGGIRWGSEMS